MKLKKHPLIFLLLIIIYSWVSASSFASFMTGDCCKQANNTSNCCGMSGGQCNTKQSKQFPCEDMFNGCSTSEPFVVYEVSYKHLDKSNIERSGIVSVIVVTLKPGPDSYIEYIPSSPNDRLYYGWSQDRSPPFTRL